MLAFFHQSLAYICLMLFFLLNEMELFLFFFFTFNANLLALSQSERHVRSWFIFKHTFLYDLFMWSMFVSSAK